MSQEHKNYYNNFSESDQKFGQLDKFLGACLQKNNKFSDFWFSDACRIIFVLSHSQGGIKYGFSVNKDLLVENLGEQSLIGQRLVYDNFTSLDANIYEYVILNNLFKSCKLAH